MQSHILSGYRRRANQDRLADRVAFWSVSAFLFGAPILFHFWLPTTTWQGIVRSWGLMLLGGLFGVAAVSLDRLHRQQERIRSK